MYRSHYLLPVSHGQSTNTTPTLKTTLKLWKITWLDKIPDTELSLSHSLPPSLSLPLSPSPSLSLSLFACQAFTLNSKEPWLARLAILSECSDKRHRKMLFYGELAEKKRSQGEQKKRGQKKRYMNYACMCQRVAEKSWRCCWKLGDPGW